MVEIVCHEVVARVNASHVPFIGDSEKQIFDGAGIDAGHANRPPRRAAEVRIHRSYRDFSSYFDRRRVSGRVQLLDFHLHAYGLNGCRIRVEYPIASAIGETCGNLIGGREDAHLQVRRIDRAKVYLVLVKEDFTRRINEPFFPGQTRLPYISSLFARQHNDRRLAAPAADFDGGLRLGFDSVDVSDAMLLTDARMGSFDRNPLSILEGELGVDTRPREEDERLRGAQAGEQLRGGILQSDLPEVAIYGPNAVHSAGNVDGVARHVHRTQWQFEAKL